MKNFTRNPLVTIASLALLTLTALPAFASSHEEAETGDIVDVAIGAGSFQTLVAAVQAADLVDALKGEGPFTVFAPNDEAFAKLPEGTLDDLLKPENKEKLAAILTYHVVPGKVMAAQVSDGLSAATLQGDNLTFAVVDGAVMIGDAQVIGTDVGASNGVIHVIDTVLIPE